MAIIFGTAGGDNLLGTDGLDVIFGLAGNDIIDGRGGVDQMEGGAGNDVFYVDEIGDWAFERVGEGTDEVRASISFVLGEHVENLVLTGTSAINGAGNSGNNRITGNSAPNLIVGGGGNDTFAGGAGDDYYVVEADVTVTPDGGYLFTGADLVIEAAGQGIDTVQTNAGGRLGENVENMLLVGDLNLIAFGNDLDNRIVGNAGRNFIYGYGGNDVIDGGTGADTMDGGDGNDTYVVDNNGDDVREAPNGGTDTVLSAVNYQLSYFVENLTLIGAAVSGTGNHTNNRIVGNALNNTLNGWLGADQMEGGFGNDIYIVDNAGDTVVEAAGGGGDRVDSSVSFSLGVNVEALILTNTGNINGFGNSGNNSITGNSGNNLLNGGNGIDSLNGNAGNDRLYGGNGNDVLRGGTGADGFFFHGALNAATNVDRILDFTVADDSIYLHRSIFTALAGDGALASSAFHAGTAAHDADDRVIYDALTGRLFYDADGNGAGAQVLFTLVTPLTALTSDDFIGIP